MDFIATGIELDVDQETGKVTLIKAVHGDDAGQPINPLLLEGQVNGGSTHLAGQALFEESLYDEKGAYSISPGETISNRRVWMHRNVS